MKIGFDCDGTLYDSVRMMLDSVNVACKELGYEELTRQKFRRVYQSNDWKRLYLDFGFEPVHIEKAIEIYLEDVAGKIPEMIPGAKDLLIYLTQEIGTDSIYFITNATFKNMERRFQEDGLTDLLGNMICTKEGKAKELTIAPGPSIYVGDAISDYLDCIEARKMGADVTFCGIAHKYATSEPEELREVVKDCDFTIDSLSEVYSWNLK